MGGERTGPAVHAVAEQQCAQPPLCRCLSLTVGRFFLSASLSLWLPSSLRSLVILRPARLCARLESAELPLLLLLLLLPASLAAASPLSPANQRCCDPPPSAPSVRWLLRIVRVWVV